jgi:hypothetical protein
MTNVLLARLYSRNIEKIHDQDRKMDYSALYEGQFNRVNVLS